MSASKSILYLIGGAATGMVVAYLLSMEEERRRTERMAQVIVFENRAEKQVQTEENAAEVDATGNDEATGNDDASTGLKKPSQQQLLAATSHGGSAGGKEASSPKGHTSAFDPAGAFDRYPAGAFDRYHGWSKWGPGSSAYDVRRDVGSIDECEAFCAKDDECHSATLIGKACGLFKNAGDDDTLIGEVNFDAVTSVRFDEKERAAGRKVCHGPVQMTKGRPFERPRSAPCYASQEEAVNGVLDKARPLKIFQPMFFGPKRDPFH